MKPIRIKPELLSLLTSLGTDSFTASEFTKAYLSIIDSKSLSFNAANQFIRRNIKRLEKREMIKRVPTFGTSPIRFELTENFTEENYQMGSPHCPMRKDIPNKNTAFKQELRNRLHKYKIELLTAMGEVEEYDSINTQAPIQQALIQDLYNDARDRSSKLLGKIRAIELLISRV